MTPDRAALRATAEAATPGPWTAGDWHVWAKTSEGNREVCGMGGHDHIADADFIAAADPSTVLALLDALDAAEAEVARLRREAVTVEWCPECDAGEPCQVVRESRDIARPETGEGAEVALGPLRDEPAPSPDDPHGACSRALVEVAVERDKARARASRLADEVERLRREWAAADRVASRCSAAARDANDRLDKVRALHVRTKWIGVAVCDHCDKPGEPAPYPCATVRALDGES